MVVKKVLAVISLIILTVVALSALTPVMNAQSKVVVLYTHGWWQPPPQRRFNPFAPGAIIIPGLVYERLAFWDKVPNKFIPELAVSWEINKAKNEIIVHLRKNVYWHDGYPFTSKDVWTTFMIYKAMKRPVWNYIDGISCPDPYTVVFHVKHWAYLLLWYLLWQDGMIVGPYHIYGKWAEEIAKASPSQYASILKSLIEFHPKTIIGTGPFMFKSITSKEVVLVKFPKYWNAKYVFIDKIVMPYIVSNQVGWEYYEAGKLDYDCFMMPPQVMQSLLKKPFAGIVKIYDLSGFALVFNFNNKWLANPLVRRAIAYVINRTKVADAAGVGMFTPVKYPTAILSLGKQWYQDLISEGALNPYNYNPAKAKALMEKAGFTLKNGVWYTPDGKPFKLTMIAPGGWTDWDAAAKEITQELKSFGIQVTLTTPESPSYWSNQWYLGGHYDLAIDFFGAWMVYPWKTFHRMFIEVNGRPRTQVQGSHFPEIYTITWNGKQIKVNATELVNVLATSFNPTVQKKAAEELALVVNQYLPEYPIAEKRLLLFYNKEHFIWPNPKTEYDVWLNAGGGHLEALAFMISHGMVIPNPKYWGITVTVPTTTTTTTTTTVTKTTATTTTMTKTVATTSVISKTVTVSGTVTVYKTSIVTVTKTTATPSLTTVTKTIATPSLTTVTSTVTVSKGVGLSAAAIGGIIAAIIINALIIAAVVARRR